MPLLAALLVAPTGCGGNKSPTAPTPPPTTPQPPPTQPDPPVSPPQVAAPVLPVTNIVAFGDSMTEGVASLEPTTFRKLLASQPYPQRLQALLAERYTSQTFTVANRGHAGEQAVDAPSRFIDVLRQDQPQVVLLLEGYNDLSSRGSDGVNPAVGALEDMVKAANARGVKVFIGTLPPERQDSDRALSAKVYTKFNSEVIRMANDKGATVVDLSQLISVSAIGDDGLHPTDAGYQQFADAFFAALRTLEKSASPTAAPTTTTAPTTTATAARRSR